VLTIVRSYDGFDVKPKIETTDNAFRITLPNINEVSPKAALSESERIVMALFEDQEQIVRKDVEKALRISQAMAVRLLKSLVDKGEIRVLGGGKNTRYVLVR